MVESFGHSMAILVWSAPFISTLGVGNLALLVRDELFQVFLCDIVGFRVFFCAGTKTNYVPLSFFGFGQNDLFGGFGIYWGFTPGRLSSCGFLSISLGFT